MSRDYFVSERTDGVLDLVGLFAVVLLLGVLAIGLASWRDAGAAPSPPKCAGQASSVRAYRDAGGWHQTKPVVTNVPKGCRP